jgi:hypothetical protein
MNTKLTRNFSKYIEESL